MDPRTQPTPSWPRHGSLTGARIVLTADRTLMAGYRTLFDGMMAASQTTLTPGWLMRRLLAPAVGTDSGRTRQAPLGLRRVEAALLRAGLDPADVAVVPPESLPSMIGAATAAVAVSSGDPLGLGMNSTTMVAMLGHRIYTAAWFSELMQALRGCRQRGDRFRVVVGGPGAWQLTQDAGPARTLGIDQVVTGYCEANVAALLAESCAVSEPGAFVTAGQAPAAEAIPPIRGATVMGMIEVSRGCGLGCDFCTLRAEPMLHLPPATILADAETNLRAGVRDLALASEDFLRYGGTTAALRPERLLELVQSLRAIPETGLIQVDHLNVASVAGWTDEQLLAARQALSLPGQEFVWVNIGIETASGPLLDRNGGRAKMRPFGTAAWADAAASQVRRLVRAGFFPLVSVVVGLPGETPDDVELTRRWVCEHRQERLAVFPLLYAPVTPGTPPPALRPEHWRLFAASYRINFRWVPRLVWEHQRLAGAPLAERLLIQALGRGQVPLWQAIFRRHSG